MTLIFSAMIQKMELPLFRLIWGVLRMYKPYCCLSILIVPSRTDVSRYSGKLEHVFETTTAQVTILSPSLDVSSIAAGGGSRLFWENGMFVVGPEVFTILSVCLSFRNGLTFVQSAGAHPGPVCYRKGGPLAVTDANLLLGRLLPETLYVSLTHDEQPMILNK